MCTGRGPLGKENIIQPRKLKRAETDLEVAKLVSSMLSEDTSLSDSEIHISPDSTRPALQLPHASSIQTHISQQLPCLSASTVKAIQTASEAQSIVRDPHMVQSTPKYSQLSSKDITALPVSASTFPSYPGAFNQPLKGSQITYSESNMSPVPQQPSTAVNQLQPVGMQPVTPHTDSGLTSQSAHRVASATATSAAHLPLPGQRAALSNQTYTLPATRPSVTIASNTPFYSQPYPYLPVPQATYLPQPGTELLMAAAYGITLQYGV